jgi:hypothetical protein
MDLSVEGMTSLVFDARRREMTICTSWIKATAPLEQA